MYVVYWILRCWVTLTRAKATRKENGNYEFCVIRRCFFDSGYCWKDDEYHRLAVDFLLCCNILRGTVAFGKKPYFTVHHRLSPSLIILKVFLFIPETAFRRPHYLNTDTTSKDNLVCPQDDPTRIESNQSSTELRNTNGAGKRLDISERDYQEGRHQKVSFWAA